MQLSGHHKWGLVIYRTTYGDEAGWNRFLERLQACAADSLDIYSRTERLGPLLQWTVVDDPTLNSATTAVVQQHFRAWVQTRSVARDGPGADADPMTLLSYIPRYRFCLCVDNVSIASLERKKIQDITRATVVYSGLEANDMASQMSAEDLQELGDEGLTTADLDNGGADDFSMLLNIQDYVSMYEEASRGVEWRTMYRRPPGMYQA